MKILYTVLFCVLSAAAIAQDADSTKKTTLTLAGIYGNNANYYGQTAESRLPYALTNATLSLPSGFYISAGAYKLINTGSGISETDLGAGFNFNLSKSLTGNIAYSHSFFPSNSPLLNAGNSNIASAGLTYDWKLLTTALGTDYAFGDKSDLFVSFNNSKLIDLGSLFSDKDFISLEPGIAV